MPEQTWSIEAFDRIHEWERAFREAVEKCLDDVIEVEVADVDEAARVVLERKPFDLES